MGDILVIQLEAIMHFEASWIEPLGNNQNLELIAAMHRPEKVGTAMHYR